MVDSEITDLVEDEEKSRRLSEIIEQKVEQEVEERLGKQDNKSDRGGRKLSRRGFLKKLGLGAAGIGAASLAPSAAAYDIRSDDALEVFSDGTKHFDVDPGGPVNINSADLELNGNQITDSTGQVSVQDQVSAPSIKVDTAVFHAKTLESGESLTIESNEGVVVSGNYEVNGTLTIQEGGSLSVV
jgi:hypothetical protein